MRSRSRYGLPLLVAAAAILVAVVVATAPVPHPVYAADFTVNTPGDEPGACPDTCTLRAAVDAANDSPEDDVITFTQAVIDTGSIQLQSGQLSINANGSLEITGPGADLLAIDANGGSRIFFIDSGATVTISGLTLTNGAVEGDGGAIFVGIDADLTLDGVDVTNSTASSGGGGIALSGNEVPSDTSLTLINSNVTGNTAQTVGGGIYAASFSSVTATGGSISGNSAADRGGGLSTDSNVEVSLSGVNVSENTATNRGGGIYIGFSSTLDLEQASVIDNTAGDGDESIGFGGGIYSDGTITALQTTIAGNEALAISDGPSAGGGIYVSGGSATLTESTVGGLSEGQENTASYGAGVYVNDFSELILDATAVTGNDAGSLGGGVYLGLDGQLTAINGSSISMNTAAEAGGGIYSAGNYGGGSTVALTGTTVNGNSAANGGGIFAWSGTTLDLTDVVIENNQADDPAEIANGVGGGIYADFTIINALRVTIANNHAVTHSEGFSQGGGVFMAATAATFTDSTIGGLTPEEGNSAGIGGGIAAVDGGASLNLTRSTVSGNDADSTGGGIYLLGEIATIVNSTISGNSASQGGGIFAGAFATANLTHATVANNQSGGAGGIHADALTSISLTNVMLVENSTQNCNLGGTFTTNGDNLSDDDSCPDDADADNNVAVVDDAMIGGLAQNPPGVTATHALLPGSPAVDGVSSDEGDSLCPDEDQRGVTRPDGPFCDIGAYEGVAETEPDLVVDKVLQFPEGGAVSVGEQFGWRLDAANNGAGDAVFPSGAVVLVDTLPSGPIYNLITEDPAQGLTCTLEDLILECIADEEEGFILPAAGSFQVLVFGVPTMVGVLTNPPEGGVCTIDPPQPEIGIVEESDEENNDCEPDTLTVVAPDLTVTKTNDVGGEGDLEGFTWTITVTNIAEGGDPSFDGTAVFFNGDVILLDNLPPGATYEVLAIDPDPIENLLGFNCGIQDDVLTCAANEGETGIELFPGESITVTVGVTPEEPGSFPNPPEGGDCVVDPPTFEEPNGRVPERNEDNNTCGDTVVVGAPDLAAVKTNDTGGTTTVDDPFQWTITVSNVSQTTTTSFGQNDTVLQDDLPSGPAYGDPVVTLGQGATTGGTFACNIVEGTLTCSLGVESALDIEPGGSFTVSFSVTPPETDTLLNPFDEGICAVDPGSVTGDPNLANNACSDEVDVVEVEPPPGEDTPTNTPEPTETPEPTLPVSPIEDGTTPTATGTSTATGTTVPTATGTTVATATGTTAPPTQTVTGVIVGPPTVDGPPPDTDDDGIPDADDPDDDNDGIPDTDDPDADGDGIADTEDGDATPTAQAGESPTPIIPGQVGPPDETPTPTPTPDGPGPTDEVAGTQRTSFVQSVRGLSDVSGDFDVVLTNLMLAGISLLLIFLTAEIFNQTIRDEQDKIEEWIQARLGPVMVAWGGLQGVMHSAVGNSRMMLNFFWIGVVLLISAFIEGFLEPGFPFEDNSWLLFLSLLVAVGGMTYLTEGLEARFGEWWYGEHTAVRVFPLAIVIALVCVLMSRLGGIVPGVLYGFVGTAVFLRPHQLTQQQEGKMVFYPLVLLLVLSVVAWLLVDEVRVDNPSNWHIFAEGVLIGLFVAGLEGIFINMIPIEYLDGKKIMRWSFIAWLAMALVTAYLFWFILLNDQREYFDAIQQTTPVAAILLCGACLLISVLTWSWFRFGPGRG